MAEIKSSTPALPTAANDTQLDKPPSQESSSSTPTAVAPRPVPFHQIYNQPAPIRTFPLPSFYPNNPISLFHVVFAWIGQALFPPPAEPSVVHTGVWSPETRTVYITDPKSIRALWEQGFYGKGSYSRSEPNWLKREQIRQGLVEGNVSEQLTNKRRTERIQAKWERAREEQEAIERTRLEEARLTNSVVNGTPNDQALSPSAAAAPSLPPVGPSELLALPNSFAELALKELTETTTNGFHEVEGLNINGLRTTALSQSVHHSSSSTVNGDGKAVNSTYEQTEIFRDAFPVVDGGKPTSIEIPAVNGSTTSLSTTLGGQTSPLKRRKSVRFSPKVESTTFQLSDPPSPYHSPASSLKNSNGGVLNEAKSEPTSNGEPKTERTPAAGTPNSSTLAIVDKEHLQLAPEEAFFLVFALGALRVVEKDTRKPLSTIDVFTLLRQHSYFPPRISILELQPDDPFLMHYVVYHHFRSLGWTPRPGVKFGVDWLLYQRGPVFDHAEFGLIVLPSYSDPRWKEQGQAMPRKSWHWLHGINRVLSHVLKSLVLVYVDIPPPAALDDPPPVAVDVGDNDGRNIASFLKKYKVREIMVRRWSSNRNR